MKISIRVQDVRVLQDGEDQGPHYRAVGYMPSGQVLIYGRILAGHSPSVRDESMQDLADWLRTHRPGWSIDATDAVMRARSGR